MFRSAGLSSGWMADISDMCKILRTIVHKSLILLWQCFIYIYIYIYMLDVGVCTTLPDEDSTRIETQSALRWGSAAAHMLRLRVRIRLGIWMIVSCDYCVMSGRGLSVGPITRLEDFYRPRCVIMRDLRTSRMRRPWSALVCCVREKNVI